MEKEIRFRGGARKFSETAINSEVDGWEGGQGTLKKDAKNVYVAYSVKAAGEHLMLLCLGRRAGGTLPLFERSKTTVSRKPDVRRKSYPAPT